MIAVSVAASTPENGSFSYPCLLETCDGRLHVTYSYREYQAGKKHKSIKHVVLAGEEPSVRLAEHRGARK